MINKEDKENKEDLIVEKVIYKNAPIPVIDMRDNKFYPSGSAAAKATKYDATYISREINGKKEDVNFRRATQEEIKECGREIGKILTSSTSLHQEQEKEDIVKKEIIETRRCKIKYSKITIHEEVYDIPEKYNEEDLSKEISKKGGKILNFYWEPPAKLFIPT